MAAEPMGQGRSSARHAVTDDLEGWMPGDDGRQDRADDEWPPDAGWAPDGRRTTGWPMGDDRSADPEEDHRDVEYRDGAGWRPEERGDWAPHELTARTGAHDDRPPGGWARHDRSPERRDRDGWPLGDQAADEDAGDRPLGDDLVDVRVVDARVADDNAYERDRYERASDRSGYETDDEGADYGRADDDGPDYGRGDGDRGSSLFDESLRRPADRALGGQDSGRWARAARDRAARDRDRGPASRDRGYEDPEDRRPDGDPAPEKAVVRAADGGPLDVDVDDRADGRAHASSDREPEGDSDVDPAAEALGTVLAEFAARRRASQEAAATAEAAASAAAERAAAAIAEAARAAEEAEAAADAAARAADDAAVAADAERRAIAAAGDRLPPVEGRRPGNARLDEEPHTTRVTIGPQFTGRQAPLGPPPGPPYLSPPGPRRHGPPPQLGPPGSGQAGPGQGGPGPNGPGQSGPWRRPPGPPGSQGWLPGEAGTVAGMPPPGGRAARRRAAEAGGMVDADSTQVLGLHALREPRGEPPRSGSHAPGSAEVTAATRMRPPAGGSGDRGSPDDLAEAGTDDVDLRAGPPTTRTTARNVGGDADSGHDREPPGWAARLPARPVLAAVAVLAALLVVAVVTVITTSGDTPSPTPAAVTATAGAPPPPPATSAPAAPEAPAVDLRSAQAVAYLTALRDADIPTSRSGQAETEAAAVVCQQLSQGAEETALVRMLPAVLPDLTRAQAAEVVEQAEQHYC